VEELHKKKGVPVVFSSTYMNRIIELQRIVKIDIFIKGQEKGTGTQKDSFEHN
jgi:hypothetical protein